MNRRKIMKHKLMMPWMALAVAALAALPCHAANSFQDALKAGEAKQNAKDFQGAREEFTKAQAATQIWGEKMQAAERIAGTFNLEGKPAEVRKVFETLAAMPEANPGQKADALFRAGEAAQRANDLAGARECFGKVLAIEDGDQSPGVLGSKVGSHMGLGRMSFVAMDFAGATKHFRAAQAVAREPNLKLELAHWIAYLLRLENKPADAKAEYVKALAYDIGGPRDRLKCYLSMAIYDICLCLKDVEGARQQLANIDQLNGSDPYVLGSKALATVLAGLPAEGERVKKQLLDLTGGRRVKVVWSHRTNSRWDPLNPFRDSTDVISIFDSDEGVARKLPISGGTPRLTPDGARVLAMDECVNRTERMLVMCDTDGRNERVLSIGPDNFLLSIWRDPKTGRDWVYVNGCASQGSESPKVFRFPIDKPEARELVWDRTTSDIYFMLSADGTRASFATKPGHMGQLTLVPNATGGIDQDKSTFLELGGGCHPGISPDNSYRNFQLIGTHQQMKMWDADGTHERLITINDMPGMNNERVVGPRWSTDPRFFTLKGPEEGKPNIWMGRFDEKFTKVEAWVKVSSDDSSVRSHAWVEPGKATSNADTSATPDAPAAAPPPLSSARWAPAEGAAFAIRNANIGSKAIAYDANGRELLALDLRQRGRALHGRHFEWLCDGGSFLAAQGGEWLGAQVRKAGAFSIEATLDPRSLGGAGPAVAWSFGTDKETLAAIAQLGKRWVMQFKGGEEIGLFARDTDAPFHLVLSVGNGSWQAYVDGKAAGNGTVKGNPADWGAGKVALGALPSGQETWRGRIQGVAVYARVLTPQDVAKQAAAMKAELDVCQPIKPLKFNGTLVRQAQTSELKDILPYTRSLTMAEYRVDKVLDGEWKQPTILVLHWAILDSVRLPLAERRPGEKVELSVEPLEGHPQLEPHRRDELPDADLDASVFYCESDREDDEPSLDESPRSG